MRIVKSDRLKKLESELQDLEQWLKLGLVPKKDIKKHEEEINSVKEKIEEEKQRLQFLKESGETEDVQPPKRATGRTAYTDMPTIPDIDMPDTGIGFTDAGFEMESDTSMGPSSSSTRDEGDEDEDTESTEVTKESDEDEEEMADEESYFSDRNRWRRGGIIDPDADEW
ncbi:MAG: hypothetical protein Tsb0021_18170 [Chlamydiales bacterium]